MRDGCMSKTWDHAILSSSRAADTPLDLTASWPSSLCDVICVCEQRGWGGLKGLAVPPCSGTFQSASPHVHHKSTSVGKEIQIFSSPSLATALHPRATIKLCHKFCQCLSVCVWCHSYGPVPWVLAASPFALLLLQQMLGMWRTHTGGEG